VSPSNIITHSTYPSPVFISTNSRGNLDYCYDKSTSSSSINSYFVYDKSSNLSFSGVIELSSDIYIS